MSDPNSEATAPASAYVFKILPSEVGKMAVVRVVSGKLSADAATYNSTQDKGERIGVQRLLKPVHVILGEHGSRLQRPFIALCPKCVAPAGIHHQEALRTDGFARGAHNLPIQIAAPLEFDYDRMRGG